MLKLWFLFLISLASSILLADDDLYKNIKGYNITDLIKPSELHLRNDVVLKLPQQCDVLEKNYGEYIAIASQVEMMGISSASSFCNFHSYIFKDATKIKYTSPKYDFVSNYNFLNMPLDDLPYNILCNMQMVSSIEYFEFRDDLCKKLSKTKKQYSFIDTFPMTEWGFYSYQNRISFNEIEHKLSHLKRNLSKCNFSKGEFYGKLAISNNILQCQTDKDDSAERYTIARYAFYDVNNDNYQDVVLYLLKSVFNSTEEAVIVLTRFSNEEKFVAIK